MANLPPAVANQHQWHDALTTLLNLSNATVKRNTELESKINELEVELSVWKQAHSTLSLQSPNPLIICILDGNEAVFNYSFIRQGLVGGQQAARQLTQGIAQHLAGEDLHLIGSLSFWILNMLDKDGLSHSLVERDICTADVFQAFLTGFSQASTRFSVLDTGSLGNGASLKVQEYLRTFSKFPQTLRVFMGVNRLDSYYGLFDELKAEGVVGKLVHVQSIQQRHEELTKFGIPSLSLDGIFVPPSPGQSVSSISPPLSGDGRQMGSTSSIPTSRSGESKWIDPAVPLHKHNPPPCNEHYLMTCSKGAACKYSHEYILTPEQLATLAVNAKKAPCNYMKNGMQCPYGDRCCWGHVCPNGPNCFHLSKGKCWFKSMHPPAPTT